MDTETSGEKPGFLRRYGAVIAVLGVMAGALYALIGLMSREKPVRRAAEAPVVRVTPPTPPPPKPPEPKPEEPKPEPEAAPDKMVEPEEAPPEEAPPEAAPTPEAAPADAPMGTSIHGNGDDGFGLAYNRTGGGNTLGGSGRSGGSGAGGDAARALWTGYARRAQSRLVGALAANKTTRAATLTVKLLLWADATGRLTRVALPDSTGDAALDEALRTEVFNGLSLGEAPPEGMPMPIVLRLSGKRP